jgi:hypothetical protein
MGKDTMTDSCHIILRWHQFEAGPCRSCVSHAPGITLTNSNNPFDLVALGFNQQLLPAGGVPVHDYDWPVDGIITPDRILERPKVSDLRKSFEYAPYDATRLRASLCRALLEYGTLLPARMSSEPPTHSVWSY